MDTSHGMIVRRHDIPKGAQWKPETKYARWPAYSHRAAVKAKGVTDSRNRALLTIRRRRNPPPKPTLERPYLPLYEDKSHRASRIAALKPHMTQLFSHNTLHTALLSLHNTIHIHKDLDPLERRPHIRALKSKINRLDMLARTRAIEETESEGRKRLMQASLDKLKEYRVKKGEIKIEEGGEVVEKTLWGFEMDENPELEKKYKNLEEGESEAARAIRDMVKERLPHWEEKYNVWKAKIEEEVRVWRQKKAEKEEKEEEKKKKKEEEEEPVLKRKAERELSRDARPGPLKGKGLTVMKYKKRRINVDQTLLDAGYPEEAQLLAGLFVDDKSEANDKNDEDKGMRDMEKDADGETDEDTKAPVTTS